MFGNTGCNDNTSPYLLTRIKREFPDVKPSSRLFILLTGYIAEECDSHVSRVAVHNMEHVQSITCRYASALLVRYSQDVEA